MTYPILYKFNLHDGDGNFFLTNTFMMIKGIYLEYKVKNQSSKFTKWLGDAPLSRRSKVADHK